MSDLCGCDSEDFEIQLDIYLVLQDVDDYNKLVLHKNLCSFFTLMSGLNLLNDRRQQFLSLVEAQLHRSVTEFTKTSIDPILHLLVDLSLDYISEENKIRCFLLNKWIQVLKKHNTPKTQRHVQYLEKDILPKIPA